MSFSTHQKLFLALGGVLAIGLLAAGVFWVSQLQKSTNSRQPDKQLSVGSHPYAYACSVVSRESLSAALNLPAETFTTQSERFASLTTQTDLAQQAGDEPVVASCLFTLETASSSRSLSISLDQHKDESAAARAYATLRDNARANYPHPALVSNLPSLGDQAFLLPPVPDSQANTFYAYALQGNTVVTYTYEPSADDADPQGLAVKFNTGRILGQTDRVMGQVVANLKDVQGASKAVVFDGIVSNGPTPLVDVCSRLNLSNINRDFTIETDNLGLTGVYTLQPKQATEADGQKIPTIFSGCSLAFRHEADKLAQDKAGQTGLRLQRLDQFPHNMQIISLGFKDQQDTDRGWASALDSADKSGAQKTDLPGLGERAYKTSNRDSNAQADTKGDVYVIQKGKRITTIIVTQHALATPYISNTETLPDDKIKQLFTNLDAQIK